MTWRFPYIVIDQNQMRDSKVVASLLDRCCRDKLCVLIPDVAGFEFSRVSSPADTWTKSLQVLAPYRKLVCASRKLTTMMDEESQRGEPCRKLIDDNITARLRSMLHDIDVGSDSSVRELVEHRLPKYLPSSRKVWDDHNSHKKWIAVMQGCLREITESTQLKRIRTTPSNGLIEWLSSTAINAVIFQGLEKRGLDIMVALKLALEPSVSAGFISAMAALAGYWLAFGGIKDVPAKTMTNDLLDLEYAIMGALSRDFCTRDKRAKIIYESVSAGFEVRLKLSDSAKHLGPHWDRQIIAMATRGGPPQ